MAMGERVAGDEEGEGDEAGDDVGDEEQWQERGWQAIDGM
jgi:hypothetical protein